MNNNEPLAFRMRPKTLEEYVGQEHVLAKDKISYNKVEGKIKTIATKNTDKTLKIIKESDYIKLCKEI